MAFRLSFNLLRRWQDPSILSPHEAQAIRELFGGTEEARRAWIGLKSGWGIADCERDLGPEGMTLLVRQQFNPSRDILAARWRVWPWSPHFPRVWAKSAQDFARLKEGCTLSEIAAAGRATFEGPGFASSPLGSFPFVTFRRLDSTTDLWSFSNPNLLVAKFPLAFDPEPHLHPDYARIGERWVLGGVPSRFVVFRGDRKTTEAAIGTAGGLSPFLDSLRQRTEPFPYAALTLGATHFFI